MALDFYCLQPIKLDESIFSEIQINRFLPNSENWFDLSKGVSSRLEQYDFPKDLLCELQALKRHKMLIHLSDFKKYNNSLSEITIFNDDESQSIDTENSGCILFYDCDYEVFFLVFCLSTHIGKNTKIDRLKGLYPLIRNELVIDTINGNSTISNWASFNRNDAIEIISKEFQTDSKSGKVEIRENSGYICSLFPEFDSIEMDLKKDKEEFLLDNHNIDLVDEKKYQHAQLSINNNGERQAGDTDIEPKGKYAFDHNKTIVFLGWRYATIYGIKDGRDTKILPLLINIQNIYFQINGFYKPFLSDFYQNIRYNDDYVELSENLAYFDKLVVAFQNLEYEKINFLSGLKPYQFEVFKEMERYWGLTEDYGNINQVLNTYQKTVERKLNIRSSRIQQKQSDILFVLAIIQVFSLTGIISGYFDFFKLEVITEHVGIYSTFKDHIFYSLSGLSTLLIVFAYHEKIWFGLKKQYTSFFKK